MTDLGLKAHGWHGFARIGAASQRGLAHRFFRKSHGWHGFARIGLRCSEGWRDVGF